MPTNRRQTAAQKRWSASVREIGCIVTGADQAHVQMHHVAGRSGMHNGEWIGEWFILPLHWHLHDVHSGDPINVTHFPGRFTQQYGTQRGLFAKVVYAMSILEVEIPFSMDVYNAIQATRY